MNKDIQRLVIDICKILDLKSEQLSTVFNALTIAYNTGWLDRAKLDKSDTEIALENGASLDDLPTKL